jgi:hypothetical protein
MKESLYKAFEITSIKRSLVMLFRTTIVQLFAFHGAIGHGSDKIWITDNTFMS